MVMKQGPKVERRNPRSQQAILEAAVGLCREQGYATVTVEGIAARAGVGKQTIYRWWPSKGAVVLDSLLDTIHAQITFPDLGDSLVEIRHWLHSVGALLSSPDTGRPLAELIGAQQSDPALAELFRERVFLPIRSAMRERIESAQRAGQLTKLDPDIMADLLGGPIWFRLLVAGAPANPERVDAFLDAALAGLRP